MFDDELPFAFKRMHEFSPADGFVEITENVGDMIKYAANEPSVGLFYIQQHTHNAGPNLMKLNTNISKKSREMTLHTEDLDDSMTMLRCMKECGNPIADEMIKDINKALSIISTKQPKRALLSNNPSSSFRSSRTSSWGPSSWGRNAAAAYSERRDNHLSSVLRSAREIRASNFKWAQLASKGPRGQSEGESVPATYATSLLQVAAESTCCTLADELPVSSPPDELHQLQEEPSVDGSSLNHQWSPLSSETYDEFRAHREAKLEDWLGGRDR